MIYTIEEIKKKAIPHLMHMTLIVRVLLVHILIANQQKKVITFLLIKEKFIIPSRSIFQLTTKW